MQVYFYTRSHCSNFFNQNSLKENYFIFALNLGWYSQGILTVLNEEKCNPDHKKADAFIFSVFSHGTKDTNGEGNWNHLLSF